MDTTGQKEKRTPKENVDGRSTSSHDNKKFRTRSMEKQRGMAFDGGKPVHHHTIQINLTNQMQQFHKFIT